MIVDGLIKNGSLVRLLRDGLIVYEGKIASLQREKDAVKEVKSGNFVLLATFQVGLSHGVLVLVRHIRGIDYVFHISLQIAFR